MLRQLVHAEDAGVVIERPAEEGEEVDHRFRQVAIHAVVEHGCVAGALAELLLVGAEDERQVCPDGRLPAEGVVELDVLGRARDPLVAADGVGNLHLRVIDDDAKVVRRVAVGLQHHEVVLEAFSKTTSPRMMSLRVVVPSLRILKRTTKRLGFRAAQRLGGGDVAAEAVVAGRALRGGLGGAHLVEAFGGAEAAVGVAAVDERPAVFW